MRAARAWKRWVPDAGVLLGVVFGAVMHARPDIVGFSVVHVDSASDEAALAASAAPWYFLPVVFGVIIWAALRAAAHAEAIAHRLRDPYGTLVLTMSAIGIEVALVVAVMTTGQHGSTVARDTMFATLMMILNGLVGIALIAGALRHRELPFNQKSSSAYLAMIAALCTIGLVLPRFTISAPGGYMTDAMEIFVAGASVVVYTAFVALQGSAHSDFFIVSQGKGQSGNGHGAYGEGAAGPRLTFSIVMLCCALATVVLLADALGDLLVIRLRRAYLPGSLQGVVIAFIILLPEGIAAVRSALSSDVQRTINILHGSALSTIGLTIPTVLIVGGAVGVPVELGLEPPEITLLAATIVVSMIHFGSGRTNLMHGVVHAMLFMLWIALLMEDRVSGAIVQPLPT
jgi:Ca2+:H+ antiporter